MRISFLENFFAQHSYFIYILVITCFLISLGAYFTNPESNFVNVVWYILFTEALYLFFACLTAITNIEQSMMGAFMIFA